MKSGFKFEVDLLKGGIKIGNITIKPQSIEKFISSSIKIIVILALMYICIKITNKLINKFVKNQKKSKFSLDNRKAMTIGTILKSIVRYIVYFFGIFSIIEIIFGTIGSIFAGLGGVAIGLGAQNLVKDIISGFFILFEDQFSVGDYITIDNNSGVVEKIELRVTRLKDFNGDVHIIPNGMITKVTNHAKGNMRFKVDVSIAYEEDIDLVVSILNDICRDFYKNNKNIVVEGPQVYGVTSLGDSGVTITINGKAATMKQWEAEVKLRQKILKDLKEKNIEIPYNKIQFVK